MPAHPWLGLSLAFASHFLLDALPHWDYPIRSSSINPDIAARMKYDGALIADLLTIGFDAALGIVVAVTLFNAQTPTSYLLALGGACAGIFPDALQFAYMRFPHQPLTSIQRFHEWIHTTHNLFSSARRRRSISPASAEIKSLNLDEPDIAIVLLHN